MAMEGSGSSLTLFLFITSQALVNLLLVGCAVTNVFDLDKDLGGISRWSLIARCISSFSHLLQSYVAFLTKVVSDF